MSDLKNILVIGLGYAGLTSAKALAAGLPKEYRVIALQEYDFAYAPPVSLRAATVPGWENKVTVPLDNVFPKGSRHLVLSGVKAIHLGAKSVRLEKDVEGFGREIQFEFAVIATGSSYAFPARTPIGSRSQEDVWATLKSFQKDVQASSNFLVVGGGATGVEFAAEVASQYPEKKVTLVHSASRLFADKAFNKKLGTSLSSQLAKKGVQLVYNTKVDTHGLNTGKIPLQKFELSDGSVVEADFVFLGYGWTPNSDLVATLDPALLNAKSFVKVKPSLQLASESYPNIFAAGDVNDIAEIKQAAFANFQAAVVAANILTLVKNPTKPSSALKEYKAAAPLALVTVGPDGGAGQLFGWVVGAWVAKTMKSKGMMLSGWFGGYNATVPTTTVA